MKNYTFIGKAIPRIDARDKVTGQTKYSTDLYFKDMLWASVLRSRYAHAKILGINVEKAQRLPGVETVLTHEDIPGHKGFGIMEPNWPVLCSDRVLYRGDALALVAARDEETADKALSLIEVAYERLPVIDSIEKALRAGAPLLHEDGNIMHSVELAKGDVEKGFEQSDIIQDGTYKTQFVEHAYIETEGGIAVYDEADGTITIWCGNQHSHRDQFQIARSLNWDPSKIRVIGSPTGGAFGGKDEITVQIHLALLAYYTKKPVRLHWDRKESIIVGAKRHPMRMDYKIGVKNDGRLNAISVDILADTGPYDTIAPPVLDVAAYSSSGPYKYDHSHIKGRSVYTNNAIGSAMRGFGCPQVTFAFEQEMDRLARRLNKDPIEFRLLNAVELGDISASGYELRSSVGIKETLLAAQESELWYRREEIKQELNVDRKYKKHGVGLASTWQDIILVPGLPERNDVKVEVGEDGKIILRTGVTEAGQGILTVCAQMLAEAMEYPISEIDVIHGDTFETPDTGPVEASRALPIAGKAILNAVERLKPLLIQRASLHLKVPEKDLVYKGGQIYSKIDPDKLATVGELGKIALSEGNVLRVTGTSIFKLPENESDKGLPYNYYTYITQLALVGVDPDTGEVDVVKCISFPDVGKAINKAGIEGQCEGGVVMGLGYALSEEVILDKGKFLNAGLETYILPTSEDIPYQETVIVETDEKNGPFGAKGVGEAPTSAIAPAIANAIYDAVGVRLTELPITPEKMRKALKEQSF